MATIVEAGIRPQTTYFVEETVDEDRKPVAPSDPQFLAISNTVTTFDPSPQMEPDARVGTGRVMPHDANRMQESHEVAVTYDLERFPVAPDGTVQDPFALVAQRDGDNQISSTVSLLRVKETSGEIAPPSTMHEYYFNRREGGDEFTHPAGADSVTASPRRTRIEYYGRGMRPSEAPLPLQPGDSSVVSIESTWLGPEFRGYQFDQPVAAGETLVVRSNDATDTGTVVNIESRDGSTTEEIVLDPDDAAANYVTTSETYSSLRISTDGEHTGNVEVYVDSSGDGSTSATPGQLLGVVFGADEYDGIEADSGVPLVGSNGGFEDPESVDWSPQYTLGSQTSWGDTEIGEVVTGATLTVSNDISEQNTDSGLFMDMRASTMEVTLESSFYGETDSVRTLQSHLAMKEGELRMRLSDGEVVIPRAYISDPGTPAFEEESVPAVVEAVWTALEPESGLAVQFEHADAA